MADRKPQAKPQVGFESSRHPSRRAFLKLSLAAGAVLAARPASAFLPKRPHVVVIGAGAFGGWTALQLLSRGARVTLFDAWGPGNSRASSGGETRVIRAGYGPDKIYTQMAARSLQLWREKQRRWKLKLLHEIGVLWLISKKDDSFEVAAVSLLQEAGLKPERWESREAARRYPQINFEGVEWTMFEPSAGYLTARRACEAVFDAFVDEGGEYRQARVQPGAIAGGELREIVADKEKLVADQYVFACGPWLGNIFPEIIGDRIKPTRQEVFFFGTPAGDANFNEENFPAWVDHGERLFYGIPGNQWRGFKIADDTRGPLFDPTNGERRSSEEALALARQHLAMRFPALKDAPLLESRVCQYENSPDGHFIIDRHPQAQNVWLVGGGSGHGFKHGPAVGEMVSQVVLGKRGIEPFFSLARFGKAKPTA